MVMGLLFSMMPRSPWSGPEVSLGYRNLWVARVLLSVWLRMHVIRTCIAVLSAEGKKQEKNKRIMAEQTEDKNFNPKFLKFGNIQKNKAEKLKLVKRTILSWQHYGDARTPWMQTPQRYSSRRSLGMWRLKDLLASQSWRVDRVRGFISFPPSEACSAPVTDFWCPSQAPGIQYGCPFVSICRLWSMHTTWGRQSRRAEAQDVWRHNVALAIFCPLLMIYLLKD